MPVIVNDGEVSGLVAGLSMIELDDASMQAAFQDRPLYCFANDSAAVDNNDNGASNVWFDVDLSQTALVVQGAIVTTNYINTANGVLHIIESVITKTLE